MRSTITTSSLLLLAFASAAFAVSSASAAETGYYAQPALHGSTLVFASEADLWVATLPEQISAEQPIIAHRLTSSEGEEGRPHISPDGRQLAFSAQYEGNVDVYMMPIDGGPPVRLTFHPGPDFAAGWSADGASVLFTSGAQHPFGRPELWRVAPVAGGGGMPERFSFGECSMISPSSTGKRFAFTRWSNENWTWKRYRGGTAPDIWLGELDSGTFKPLTTDRANDLFPMWVGGRVYFLSDRSGVANIWSVSPDAGEGGGAGGEGERGGLKQHTKFAGDAKNPTALEGYDVRWPSADQKRGAAGGRIVFAHAGGLALLNLKDDSITRLNIQIASDRVAARRRFAPLNESMTEFALAPDAKTLLIGSRGEMLAADVETGAIRQITRDAASREWGGAFIDKERIALISDFAGEQQMCVMPIDGTDAPRRITSDREAWLFPPVASSDGKQLTFADKTLRLHIINVGDFQHRQIDQAEAGEIRDYRFSPDSQWLAYAKPMPNGRSNVFIASVRTGKTFAVSGPLDDDFAPRWDPKGKYLYMLSNRSLNPVMSQFDLEHAFINTTQVIAVPLTSDTPPPDKVTMLAAKFDTEEWTKPLKTEDEKKDKEDGAKKDDGNGDEERDEAAADAPQRPADPNAPPANALRVDTDGLAERQFILPIPPGNYGRLEALPGALLYVSQPTQGLMDDSWPAPPKPQGTLRRWDILKGEGKDIAQKVNEFALSADCAKIAFAEINDEGKPAVIKVISSSGSGGDDDAKKIAIADHQMRVDVPSEWKQILNEAWRLQRDFYWAPNMVGVDWPAMRTKYEALLPRIGTRGELNDLIGQLIGELGTSHTYIWGGQPAKQMKPVAVGMLGADIEFDGSGFRIARILPAEAWGKEYASPLAQPHLNIKEGWYIRAINGVSLSPSVNLFDLLQDQAGKFVRLTVSDDAAGANTRDVEVKTITNESQLRYAAWVENNRKYVEERSQGKIGYLHIPDMGGQGLVMFSRYFYPQFNKPAVVIDVRDNGGGFVSQMIIERLSRRLIAFDQPRHGVTGRYPQRALNAHLVTLIDQHAGSDGDIFPNAFRKLGLGPLIGMRTWGGVVGIRGDKMFVDMGLSTQPEFAWWESEGGWVIENEGVSPDIELDLTPADRMAGRDPQLDRAIEYLRQKLEEEPRESPKLPPWPVRAGK